MVTTVSVFWIDFMCRHGSLHTLIGWYVPMPHRKIIRFLFCFFLKLSAGNTGISPITCVRLQLQFLFKCDKV